MNLIPYHTRRFWAPFRTCNPFTSELEKLFNSPIFGEGGQPMRAFAPAIDLYEDDNKIVVKADLPGIEEKDIDVSVTDGVLTLKGEKKHEHEEKDGNWHRIERSYGSFTRSLALPDGVDHEKVAAQYKNGVLEITAPKSEATKPKTIKVEVK
ncbi:MAG: Hsp20/alpha crystallin family protein [bacterium]